MEIKELKETRTIKADESVGLKIDLVIEYHHQPNVVGPRSDYTGLPIWVGKTTAKTSVNGGTAIETIAYCWLREPFTYSRGRVVSTGRLLKELEYPTYLAKQVK